MEGGGTKWLQHPPAIEVPGSGLYHPGRGGNKGGGSPFSLCPGRVGDPGWGGKGGGCGLYLSRGGGLRPASPSPHSRERTVYPVPSSKEPPALGAILGATKTTSPKTLGGSPRRPCIGLPSRTVPSRYLRGSHAGAASRPPPTAPLWPQTPPPVLTSQW